jgi:hypothetical protein
MDQSNRRMEDRINLRVPLRFRAITDPPEEEQSTESVNLSQRGLFFSTTAALKVGTQVEVFLKMPHEISGNPPTDVRCVGRVVHVQPGWLLGRAGVGVRIERYESIARERWAN